jgi:hypothetical protein
VLFGLTALPLALLAQEKMERRPTREAWDRVMLQARVEEMDLEAREVTLRGPVGDLVTVEVGDEVKRLDEFEVGDIVSAEFWTYLKAEFRDPTPEEQKNPVMVLAGAGKAMEDMPPGAAVGALVKAVVTVEIINRPDMLVVVRGPEGNYATVPAEDPALLEDLHVGELVILTYAEALALSLEKTSVEAGMKMKK